MKLDGFFDHDRCQGDAVRVPALETLSLLLLPPGLYSLCPVQIVNHGGVHPHLFRELHVLFDFLLGVPEPLVDLLHCKSA